VQSAARNAASVSRIAAINVITRPSSIIEAGK
jgi:hypothetical protein